MQFNITRPGKNWPFKLFVDQLKAAFDVMPHAIPELRRSSSRLNPDQVECDMPCGVLIQPLDFLALEPDHTVRRIFLAHANARFGQVIWFHNTHAELAALKVRAED